jgi:hypothetical protein
MLRKTAGNYRDVGGVAMIDEMKPTAKTRRMRRKGDDFVCSFFFASVVLIWISPFASRAADAPVTPFYYASATAVEQQVVTLVVGVNENVGQAVVSGDRKYVTMNMDASLMGDARIRSFTYQRGGRGFVGSVVMQAPVVGGDGLTPSIAASAGEISPEVSVLDKPGMVLIAPLER